MLYPKWKCQEELHRSKNPADPSSTAYWDPTRWSVTPSTPPSPLRPSWLWHPMAPSGVKTQEMEPLKSKKPGAHAQKPAIFEAVSIYLFNDCLIVFLRKSSDPSGRCISHETNNIYNATQAHQPRIYNYIHLDALRPSVAGVVLPGVFFQPGSAGFRMMICHSNQGQGHHCHRQLSPNSGRTLGSGHRVDLERLGTGIVLAEGSNRIYTCIYTYTHMFI
jgi:hypothetical protein